MTICFARLTNLVDKNQYLYIFNSMVEYSNEQQLTGILRAVADPTRRSILTLLVQHGPTRVTELAEHFDMSLNAISKHIKVLEAAGLATRNTIGRVHLIEADLAPAREIDTWFSELRSIWDLRIDELEKLLTEEDHRARAKLKSVT